jgi:hypothetical protein
MSTPRNPIELVDRYLQAVRFWLPKTDRQDDILAELGEDLRSQIEEKESELGRPLDKNEVSEILKRCGVPMLVAARLGPKRSLIGPTLYPIYIFVLKMVLLWILVPVFLFIVGPATFASTHNLGAAIGNTVGALWSGLFIAAGIITLVFAILERSSAFAHAECKWDPLNLPAVKRHQPRTSLAHSICDLAFGWFGLIWLLLLPHYPFMIFGPASAFLVLGPFWQRFYPLFLLFSVLGLLRPAIRLAKPHWAWFPSASQLLQTMFGMVFLYFILRAIAQAPPGEWQMFVALSDAARNSAQYIRVVAIVNVSILIGLAGTWLGFSIALIVQAWQFMKYLRNRQGRERQTASLQLQ